MTRYRTRRAFLRAGATATAFATVPAGATASKPGRWTTAETPTSDALYDGAYATDGAYAVDGGWSQEPTDTGENLEAVSQVGRSPGIAVGAGGTVLEH